MDGEGNRVVSVRSSALSRLVGGQVSLSLLQQENGYERTKARVREAAATMRTAAPTIAHDVLSTGVDFLQLAPIPALDLAGSVLLSIWDAVQAIKDNRVACLRLTERCANALLTVRQHVLEAGSHVSIELEKPLMRLHEAFKDIHEFLLKQKGRRFIQRYLNRVEDEGNIRHCGTSLDNALLMFSLEVQIRTLKLGVESRTESQKQRTPVSARGQLRGSVDTPGAKLGHTPDADPSQDLLSARKRDQDVRDREADQASLQERLGAAMRDDVTMFQTLEIRSDEMPETITTLKRVLENTAGRTTPRIGSSTAGEPANQRRLNATIPAVDNDRTSVSPVLDGFGRQFIMAGIEALVRLSQGTNISVPSWTITRDEVELKEEIGRGFFSKVYKGQCRGRTVAVKELDAITSTRKLFVNEVDIWIQLRHPNVIELFGASSASSNPPWFMISPYYRNGNLVQYLKGLDVPVDPVNMMHDIASGMSYLHEKDVLHGDLKASNILVDDNLRCIVSDFGQSELKSEYCRVTMVQSPTSRGTMMWQAPEIMMGLATELTPAADIYAFGILCAEILNKGALPWGTLATPEIVFRLVCHENKRPQLPLLYSNPSPGHPVSDIIRAAWDRYPRQRPSFKAIVRDCNIVLATTGRLPDAHPITEDTLSNSQNSSKSNPSTRAKPPLPSVPISTPTVAITPATTTPEITQSDRQERGLAFYPVFGERTANRISDIYQSGSTTRHSPAAAGPTLKVVQKGSQESSSVTSERPSVSFDEAPGVRTISHDLDLDEFGLTKNWAIMTNDTTIAAETAPGEISTGATSPRLSDTPESKSSARTGNEGNVIPTANTHDAPEPPRPYMHGSREQGGSTGSAKEPKQSKPSIQLPFGRKTKVDGGRKPFVTPGKPEDDDVEGVKMLLGVGFSRAQAISALEANGYDLQNALDSLLRP
ncbi:kinase-like protein [Peniophora sp. CONT]|nr:kinase-like protein [Peniophora sp. CONT]